jgi:hypothetical protein
VVSVKLSIRTVLRNRSVELLFDPERIDDPSVGLHGDRSNRYFGCCGWIALCDLLPIS